MNPTGLALVALLLGSLIGLVVGALVAVLVLRRRRTSAESPIDDGESTEPLLVPRGIVDVLEVVSAATVLVGPHDEVLRSSDRARSFGLARGSRVGVSDVLELVRRVRRERMIADVDLELKRGRGLAVMSLAIRVAPLEDGLVLVLAEDRTAALRVEETRRDFVANVSHELKTPIGAISLLAEAVREAADDPTAVLRFADRMEMESARLTELVGQIIDLSRLQGDEPLSEPETLDVATVCRDAVDRCQVDAERHEVTLAVAPIRSALVLGDARLLTVAVENLVQNAVAYSDPGARVVVAAQNAVSPTSDGAEATVAITVSDNGIGISDKDLSRIFERFYRVDYARSRANGGTGLGLAIVKHIVASHGGEVAVWSQLGRGSTFTITLPAVLPVDPDGPTAGSVVDHAFPQAVETSAPDPPSTYRAQRPQELFR